MKNPHNKDLGPQNLLKIVLPVFCLNSIISHILTAPIIIQAQPLPYVAQDNITIDCGSFGNNTDVEGRSWIGDTDSTWFPLQLGQNKDSIASEVLELLSITNYFPYKKARFSRSEFTYMIPLRISGPKFLRLHFYASTYQNFDSSNAFFSVKADQYTLLNNFTVSHTVSEGYKQVVKEFCVVATKSNLKITFSPSSLFPEAFAFVNAIEVISMPTDLYFPDSSAKRGLGVVGEQAVFYFGNDSALETMYRINVGGDFVYMETDMFRKWDDNWKNSLTEGFPEWDGYWTNCSMDGNFCQKYYKHDLKFIDIPSYTAPEDVYRTGGSMIDWDDDGGFNDYKPTISWACPVEYGFQYMVRLHFCDFSPVMNSNVDRSFYITIANQTAERAADVIKWSGGKYIPYFKDYVVNKFGKGGDHNKIKLTIALHANPQRKSTYSAGILNGIEIFKLNDTNGNLASFNPLSMVPPSHNNQQGNGKRGRPAMVIIVSGTISGIIFLSILGFFILKHRIRTVVIESSKQGSTLPSELCRYFSLAEIRAATKNFDADLIIGVGGFGNVYKGYIDSGTTAVAIKRLKPQSSQGANEFKTEIQMLSHLRHRHLVSLIGYCNEYPEMILVYDHVSRGTLSNHLYNTDEPPLQWMQRLKICIGAASGLHYLHTGVKHTIIHRDVKTSNILLDERFVAKVSDFGLSKVGPTTLSKTHVSTMVKGSFGYLDPEYYRRQQLTEKSDVYSFGVVLCEVLCGRPPLMRKVEKRQMNLAEWVRTCHQERKLHQIIIDPYLVGKIAPECLKKFGEIAVNCMLDNGAERPSMKEALRDLEFAMQLQNNAEENIRLGGEPTEMNEDGTIRIRCSWEDESGAVFSDLKGLQGR